MIMELYQLYFDDHFKLPTFIFQLFTGIYITDTVLIRKSKNNLQPAYTIHL